jgi:hypothetical protein
MHPNLASLATVRATITDCGKPRDAIVLHDHAGNEIAHAKPSPENQYSLAALTATFNALRGLHVACLNARMNRVPLTEDIGLALDLLKAVHLLGMETSTGSEPEQVVDPCSVPR